MAPGQTLTHRGWGDEYVVYNDLSGDTHLLGGDAMAVLLALRAAPHDLHALAEALDAHDDAAREVLAALLDQLRALSLIENV